MAEVKILLEGFTNADQRAKGEDEITRCTTTLVRSYDFIILSDPGVLENQEIMIDALAEEGLTVADITHVFITHSHLDHYRNLGMFPTAKAIDYWGLWDGGKCDPRPNKLNDEMEIVETPGHSLDGLTMLVKTDTGIVAIVGDLWWSKRGPKIDPFASDPIKLSENREKIFKLADSIIPGHGGMFGSGR